MLDTASQDFQVYCLFFSVPISKVQLRTMRLEGDQIEIEGNQKLLKLLNLKIRVS